jgi:trk system potassium uptake protein TrkA
MKIVIIGAGEVGFHIAEKLAGESIDVVVIEADAERLHQLEEHVDAQFVLGSGSSPDVLKKAGIAQASMVIAVSDQDEVNLVACLVANHYSPGSVKVLRVRNPSFLKTPEVFAGLRFDLFINPEYEAADKIARLLDVPQALDIVEFASGRILMVGFSVETHMPLANRKLFTLGELVPGYTPLVAAIYRGKDVVIPRGASSLEAGDIVYFAVVPDELPRLLKLTGKPDIKVKRVMIFGGSNTGLHLAQILEERNMDVKLIEPDHARCAYLADQLSHTTVLHGMGMDGELLTEENIANVDAFIAVSKDAEDNILSCLLAKSLGAKVTMTMSNRIDYSSLVSSIGIDAAVNPQLTAVSRILQYLRQGRVAMVEAIREANAEAIEFVALESCEAVGPALKDIKFPDGALVIAVVRGEQVMIPSGNTIIMPEDRVIIFANRSAISKVEKLFAVKLEYF